MGSLIKKLLAWFRSLLGLEASPPPSLPHPPAEDAKPSPLPTPSPIADRPPAPAPKPAKPNLPNQSAAGGDATTKSLSPRLRRIVYQAFWQLDRGEAWVDLAPLGNALRTVDKSFVAQKYGFARLSELLEAAPDLVSVDRPKNQARLHQPADMKTLLRETFRGVSASNDWAHHHFAPGLGLQQRPVSLPSSDPLADTPGVWR
ncbi:MAG: OST-HTH/LOTUS domain-containing protein [Nodosilinea sp.]